MTIEVQPTDVFDPPFVGMCGSDPAAPTCSVFAAMNPPYVIRECTSPWYPADFPSTPDDDNTVIWDGVLPGALENSPDSCDMGLMRLWVHQQGIEGFGRSVNVGIRFTDPGDSTLVGRGGFSVSNGASDQVVALWAPGRVIATSGSPIRLQVTVAGSWLDPGALTDPFEFGAAIWSDEWCGAPPAPKIQDLADTPTKLYLVGLDGSAWMWVAGQRTKLAIDMDGRQMAGGMLAVATAGETALFCDWDFNLWATGQFYHQNDVTGEWELINLLTYMVPVDINARGIYLMGPHGIGPSYMNDTALWVVGKRNLWGMSTHLYASLMNGLLPSSPNPIAPPREGGYTWPSSTHPDAVPVHQFSYRGWGWRSLATSNFGAYAQFERRAGTAQPYGQAIG